MDSKSKIKRLIDSAERALTQLDKLINQNIDLAELDPEKAKAAAQGKIEAIEGSMSIINKIDELRGMLEEVPAGKKANSIFAGVESKIK